MGEVEEEGTLETEPKPRISRVADQWIGLTLGVLVMVIGASLLEPIWADWLLDLIRRRGLWAITHELLVPAMVGVGGTAVAWASWRTSQSATRIARDAANSEKERARRDEQQREDERAWQYRERVDAEVASVVRAADEASRCAAGLAVAIRDGRISSEAEWRLSSANATLAAKNELALARMRADPADSAVLDAAAEAMSFSSKLTSQDESELFGHISASLLRWRWARSAEENALAQHVFERIAANAKRRSRP